MVGHKWKRGILFRSKEEIEKNIIFLIKHTAVSYVSISSNEGSEDRGA